jgi:hypothetical protein
VRVRAACVLVGAWAVHLAVYPAFMVYGWMLVASAEAFEAYLLECCEHWEGLRHTQLDQLEHSTL